MNLHHVIMGLLPMLILGSLGSQYLPITSKIPGIVKGSDSAELQVQIIYDPMCDDSAKFDEQVWYQVEQYIIYSNLKDKIRFRYLGVSLPYHITAHKINQAIVYLNDNKNKSSALQCLRYFLQNIHLYDEKAMLTTTIENFQDKIAKYVSDKYDIPYTTIRQQVMHFSDYDRNARAWDKFVFGNYHLAGTPRVMINWVAVDGGTSYAPEQWIGLLRKLAT